MGYQSITIDKEIISEAKKETSKRMAFGFRGPIQEQKYKYNMIFISCIGELVFQKYLYDKGIKYVLVDFDFQGREIIVNSDIIEIRTSGYENDFSRLNFIYNVDQYSESTQKKIKYVVQIFINGYLQSDHSFLESECNTAVIAGYMDFDKIAEFPIVQNIYRPNYKIRLDELFDINKILK